MDGQEEYMTNNIKELLEGVPEYENNDVEILPIASLD